MGRCRKRSGKMENVGVPSRRTRREEGGESSGRLVGSRGNGNVARERGEPGESGEVEDAYVGT